MQSCDYFTTPKEEHKQTRILRKGGIKFYSKWRKLPHSSGRLYLADNVSLTFRTHKNEVNNSTVTQWWTGKYLCPVQVWADIATRLETYLGSSDDTSMNTAWVENHKTNITSQMTHISLRSGTLYFREERLGFSHKEVVTHSLQSGFAVEPFLAIVYP